MQGYIKHISGIKSDNRIENLEWCTRSENMKHSYKLGTHVAPWLGKRGVNNPNSKPIIQYNKLGRIIKKWACAMDVQRKLGINSSHISSCCKGTRITSHGFKWKYL